MSDIQNLLQDVIAHAKSCGADAADALHYEASDLRVNVRNRAPEELERSEEGGVVLRVFVGQKNAIVSSSDTSLKALKESAERAVEIAKVSPEDPYTHLAPEDRLVKNVPDLDLHDASEPSAEALQSQCKACEEVALQTGGITNSEGADAHYGSATATLVTSQGFTAVTRSSSHSLSLSVIGGEGETMERDYDYTVARHGTDLRAAEEVGRLAAERTMRRMAPRKVNTQAVPIVFDPRVSKGLVSNFARAISGASVARGTSFLKDAMGEQLFTDTIQIIDEPHRKRALGSEPFDDEGVANDTLELVKNGVLQHWLLDTRSAKQLGLETNGRASRGVGSHPSPSTTNLYMQAGAQSPEALIGDVETGFYVTDLFGMGVNLITGDYSQGASGLWIEKGELAYAVSEVTIAGQLRDMFKQLTPANDLVFEFATNCPTVRVDGMTVAGN